MKFLVDAHLPYGLCNVLRNRGHDVRHTSELISGNQSSDTVIGELSAFEQRILISKDIDFYYSHLLRGRPFKLDLNKAGNLRRSELIELVTRHLPNIEAALEECSLLELDRQRLLRLK